MFAVFPHLTGIYPVIIIMLAALEKTQSEMITTQASSTYHGRVDVQFKVESQQSATRGTETISLHDIEGSSAMTGGGEQVKLQV